MDMATYRSLLAQARRHSRRADEAEDLVQQALLAGLEAGRDDPDRNVLSLYQPAEAPRRR